jgi:UPF0755 protein
MRLQSDPTIVYGLVFGKGTLGHPITKAELDQPTPYNTYNIDGLPPGPICNPGKAALEAAANPMRTKELYFVADGTGGHAFAETLDQHLKNVAHWRQIEQDAKDRLAPDATPTPGLRRDAGQAQRARRRRSGDLRRCRARRRAGRQRAVGDSTRQARREAQGRGRAIWSCGALSAARAVGASLDTLGAVVTGVNDEPPTQAFPDDPGPDGPDAAGRLGPAFGGGARRPEGAHRSLRRRRSRRSARRRTPPIRASRARRALRRAGAAARFDASEGTPFDPQCATRPTISTTPTPCRRSTPAGEY